MIIESRNQFMSLCTRLVNDNMPRLPFKYTAVVIRLLLTAFDVGYQIAKLGKAEVEE